MEIAEHVVSTIEANASDEPFVDVQVEEAEETSNKIHPKVNAS